MSNGGKTLDQWLVRLETEQVKGPYSTDAVSKMILEGILSGAEDVAVYPDGEWVSLSKQPEFYETLLESLENPTERDEKKAQKMDAETVIKTVVKPKSPLVRTDIKPVDDSQEPESTEIIEANLEEKLSSLPSVRLNQQITPQITSLPAAHVPGQLGVEQQEQVTIELQNIKQVQKKELKKIFPFIALLTVIVFVAGYLFLNDDSSTATGWVLVIPQKGRPQITAEELKSYKIKSLAAIKSGGLEEILMAQKNLVQAVEGSEKDLESMGLLCSTYNILWPFTKQTTQDLKAFATVTQMARSANPLSSYSDACQAFYLLAKGQILDARGIIERTLDQNSEDRFLLYPFLYLAKADLLEESQNFINAEAYYTEAGNALPDWAWARFGLARVFFRQDKFNESRAVYATILAKNADSKSALFGLGLNESKGQSNSDKAYDYFSKGYAIKRRLPKAFHIEALLEYIKILIARNDSRKALEVAQFGLQISPSHKGLQETVLSLGGDDRVHSNNNTAELILLGDQFARSGDHLAAQAQYKAAFDLEPTNATVALKAAKSLWVLNQTREALSWLDKAIKVDPKMLTAYALKADYLSQKYNFIEAAKVLLDANRAAPQNFEIVKTQALLEFRKNNMPSAVSYGERAYKLYDADVELLTLLANANISVYLNAPARTRDEQDKKEKALTDSMKYSSKAVDLEPGLPESQITYAKYIFASQGSIKSENYLRELIKNFPYTQEYRIGMAEFYESQERFKGAAEIYQQLVDADPRNKKANLGLARSYRFMNEHKLAQKYYMAAAVIDPSDVEPLFSTAQLQLEMAIGKESATEISQALSKFQTARRINPNYPRISYYIARCHMERGEFAEAVEMIKEEKAKNPQLADPYLLAAEVYERKKQFAECAAEYSLAIKLRPTSAELYVKAASCYRKSDAVDIAQDMLDIAKQKETGYPAIYREQGFVFEKRGLFPQAKEAWELYLELSPNALDKSEIDRKLSSLGN